MSMARGRDTLVVTLGPASWSVARELAEAGATALRLNASHMDATAVRHAVEAVRRSSIELPVVVDLQGAKMRLGRFHDRDIAAGERVVLAGATLDPGEVPLPHAELFAQARCGDTLSVDDDRLRFEVVAIAERRVVVQALTGGVLRSRKGINVVEHPIVLDDLTTRDVEIVSALAGAEGLAWAVSFMADGEEAGWVRRRVGEGVVVGKVERAEAVQNLTAIAAATDQIWICRGDLGAQIGPAALARFVARFDPRALPRPVLMAGQVLEHLTAHAEPTRSEVCHLHDLLARGYAGIVLSDETAIGEDPVRATRRAAELLRSLGEQPAS